MGRLIAIALLLTAPPVAAAVTSTEALRWFGTGGAAWGASVVVKVALVGVLYSILGDESSKGAKAALHGVLSAACELGVAAACFALLLPEGSIWTAVAFGAGAGWSEAVALLAYSVLIEKAPPPAVSCPWFTRWTFVVERTGAMLGHAGSRGLIWLALQGPLWYVAPALAGFAVVDGLAVYGTLREWDWLEPRVWRGFNGAVTAISVAEVLLCWLLA